MRTKAEARDYDLKRTHGISAVEYEGMLLKQAGKCAICSGPPNGKDPYFHVDHCHKTGKIRELLCSVCNTGLGSLQDSVNVISRAIAYLQHHEQRRPDKNM